MRSRTRPSENTNKKRAWGDEATRDVCRGEGRGHGPIVSDIHCLIFLAYGRFYRILSGNLKLAIMCTLHFFANTVSKKSLLHELLECPSTREVDGLANSSWGMCLALTP